MTAELVELVENLLIVTITHDERDPNYGVPFEERTGNCLEFAGQYLMGVDDDENVLVHGSIQRGNSPRIGHAWIKCADGGAFDPTLGMWFPEYQMYLAWANATEDIAYTKAEACTQMLVTGHYGIWHPEADCSGSWGGTALHG